MKTVKYNEAEKLVHRYIERFTNLRIRNNREFFNVKPEEALSRISVSDKNKRFKGLSIEEINAL